MRPVHAAAVDSDDAAAVEDEPGTVAEAHDRTAEVGGGDDRRAVGPDHVRRLLPGQIRGDALDVAVGGVMGDVDHCRSPFAKASFHSRSTRLIASATEIVSLPSGSETASKASHAS